MIAEFVFLVLVSETVLGTEFVFAEGKPGENEEIIFSFLRSVTVFHLNFPLLYEIILR